MTQAQTYQGGCHCKNVRYEVTTDLAKVMECNCSMCSKKGHLLTFVPANQFKLLSGDRSLSDYQFNHKRIHHLFCTNCGVGSFARGTGPKGEEMYAANVRCFDDVNLDELNVTKFDGKSL